MFESGLAWSAHMIQTEHFSVFEPAVDAPQPALAAPEPAFAAPEPVVDILELVLEHSAAPVPVFEPPLLHHELLKTGNWAAKDP